VFTSALTGEGLAELKKAIFATLAAAPEPRASVRAAAIKLPAIHAGVGLEVARESFGYTVRGDRVERLVERTDLDSEGALARFQVELDRLGVNAALESAGVQPGDTVRIAEVEFEYQP
jgi:GTPase